MFPAGGGLPVRTSPGRVGLRATLAVDVSAVQGLRHSGLPEPSGICVQTLFRPVSQARPGGRSVWDELAPQLAGLLLLFDSDGAG